MNHTRYLTEYSLALVSIFGRDYYESSTNTFFLLQRNRLRVKRALESSAFFADLISRTVVLSGLATTTALLVLPQSTLTGQLTIELVNPAGPLLFSLIVCWFSSQLFVGTIKTSAVTLLIAAALDEEMFSREQRFMDPELREFLDTLGTEQNEYYKEQYKKVVGHTRVSPLNESLEDAELVFVQSFVAESDSTQSTRASAIGPSQRNANLRHDLFLEDIAEEDSAQELTPRAALGKVAKFVS